MRIEEIKRRLELRQHAKTLFNNPFPIRDVTFEIKTEDDDIAFLLERNQRLAEALEQIAENVGHDDSYDTRKRALEALHSAKD